MVLFQNIPTFVGVIEYQKRKKEDADKYIKIET
jgi:hypothetical protein